jgi:hypothetical protein
MNYTIHITGLKRKNVEDYQDVVTHVSWRLTGKSPDGYVAHFQGATPIEDLTQIDSLTFIPYSDLKEKEIVSWIEGVIAADTEYKEHILNQIKKSIELEREVELADENNLPWQP